MVSACHRRVHGGELRSMTPLKPVSPEVLAAAIEILGTTGISKEETENRMRAIADDPMQARRLIDFIPEAFGLVLLAHNGKPIWPTKFSALDTKGESRSFPLAVEPIFDSAIEAAQSMFHEDRPECFQNIACRSAIMGAANNLLKAGGSIDGAVVSGPALLGIPAEIYPEQKTPWLTRVARKLGRWVAQRSDPTKR